ncbi:MAG: GTPase domain-containing protein, partial [Acidimicrobiia bacterium]|nr:GTPase domain-containing protein [Acidimicrobiia bacterium]
MTLLGKKLPRVDLLRDVADDLEECMDFGDPATAAEISGVVSVIRHYVIPRIEDPAAPLNVVFVGPTGSGKSTLVNSVVGREVTRASAMRPTTTKPLVYSHVDNPGNQPLGPLDVDLDSGDARILRFISLVDTPDLDSTSDSNRRLALNAMAGADVVVFVTSSLRYADRVPWKALRSLAKRDIPVIHVLNRLGAETSGSVIDYRRRLRDEGMTADVLAISEYRLVPHSVLPRPAIGELRTRILDLISEIDRGSCLESSLDAVRSNLDSAGARLNAGLVDPAQKPDPSRLLERVGDRDRLRDTVKHWKFDLGGSMGFLDGLFGRGRAVAMEVGR